MAIREPAAEHQDRLHCRGICDWLCKAWIVIFNKRKTGDPCVYFPERVINRPDPCIYSQFLLMQLNKPVTWDNPDIAIMHNGVAQYTYDLTPNTQYDVVVKVHNSSVKKPALGTQVSIRWIEFGAGGQIRHPIADLIADVPVWPGVSTVIAAWKTPASPGHYCIEVELSHSQDANPANNLGWNNTEVKAAASQVETPIRIFNRAVGGPPPVAAAADAGQTGSRSPWNLVEVNVDSYRFQDAYGNEADPETMFAPRPPAWPARVEPRLFHFDPGETYRDVLLVVDAPDAAGPSEPFNVTAYQGGTPLGGITVTVKRKD